MPTHNARKKNQPVVNHSVRQSARKDCVPKKTKSTRNWKRKPVAYIPQSIPPVFRRVNKKLGEKVSYVLTLSVIKSDGDAIYNFKEHDVHITSPVIKELDQQRSEGSEGMFNIRKAQRSLDLLTANRSGEEMVTGIPLTTPSEMVNTNSVTGRLFIDYSKPKAPENTEYDLDPTKSDDQILMACLALKTAGKHVVLVTKDLSLRLKAVCCQIEAEDYLNETVGVDIVAEEDILTGYHYLPTGLWDKLVKQDAPLESKYLDEGIAEYIISHSLFEKVHPNEFLIFSEKTQLFVVSKPNPQTIVARTFPDFTKNAIWGVKALNMEQALGMQLLMCPEVSGLTLAGCAGTGKNLLALAVGLHLMRQGIYKQIIYTKSAIGLGSDEEIGFRAGTEAEKMRPIVGALLDSYSKLRQYGKKESKACVDFETTEGISLDLIRSGVSIIPLHDVLGRTFDDAYILVDEAQNLTRGKLKTIATRVGKGSKIVYLGNGNVDQIKDTNLTVYTNGLARHIRAFANCSLSGHITLKQVLRSDYAAEAEKRL